MYTYTDRKFQIKTQIFRLRARLKGIETYDRAPMPRREDAILRIERALICAEIEALCSLLDALSDGSVINWADLRANL